MPDECNKRRKTNTEGSNSDWNFMLNYQNRTINKYQSNRIDTSAPLYQYTPLVLYCFHLLYEDLNLNISMDYQSKLLGQVSVFIKLLYYV